MPSTLYDLFAHGRMIRDQPRSAAYAKAIAALVRPGDVVVDVGTGTGFLAVLACTAGAQRVYAIESEAIIDVARDIVRANGVADRVQLIHASSNDVELPERADVLLGDVHGVLPFFLNSLSMFLDARDRFIRPGGIVIPARDVIRCALVESPAAYAPHDQPWGSGAYGVDFSPARQLAVNDMRKYLTTSDEVASNSVLVTTIDYATATSTDFSALVELTASRDASIHGFALWFDTTLAPGVELTNAPDAPEALYGRLFLPFEHPVVVTSGEVVTLDLAARLIDGQDYLWRWNSKLRDSSGATRELFRQSNFFGVRQKTGQS